MNQNFYFRVDPRLVHATIMNIWVPSVGAKALLICDDEVTVDRRLRKIQELSAVGLVKVAFSTAAEIVQSLSKFHADDSLIVLFTSLGKTTKKSFFSTFSMIP